MDATWLTVSLVGIKRWLAAIALQLSPKQRSLDWTPVHVLTAFKFSSNFDSLSSIDVARD